MKFTSLRKAVSIAAVAGVTFLAVAPAASESPPVPAKCGAVFPFNVDYLFILPRTQVAAGGSYIYDLPQTISGGGTYPDITTYGVSVHAWDGYEGRSASAATGPHNEQLIIDFLDASGGTIASTVATEDLDDGLESADAHWPLALQLAAGENINRIRVRHADASGTPETALQGICVSLFFKHGTPVTTTTVQATTTTEQATTTTTTTTTVPTRVLPEVEVADPADPVDGTPAFTG